MIRIPKKFRKIPYDGVQYPGSPQLRALKTGANCQRFAYELLRHYGYEIGNFRSSNLWEDSYYTVKAKRLRPLDILLFNKDLNAYGAHVAVWLGDNKMVHLSKKASLPEVTSLPQMLRKQRYKVFIGAKRVKLRFRHKGTVTDPV